MRTKARKLFHASKHRAHRHAAFLSRHPYLIPVNTFLLVVFFGLVLFIALGGTTKGATDVHIVDLYVDQEVRTVSTRAKTVGELLERLNITVRDEDIIEPSADTRIIEDSLQVNVYRARPVEIIEGERTYTILSAQRSPRLLVADAGLKLFKEDLVQVVTREKNVLDSGPGDSLVIDRSIAVKLNIYGVIREFRTTQDTVQQVLDANNLRPAEGEIVQPADRDSPLAAGMLISINRIGIKTETKAEDIPYDTQSLTDNTIETGKREVRTPGANGERVVIYEITEKDGVEITRKELQTVITKEPVTEVIVRGTKLATLSPSISVSGEKASLMAAAGIAESDYPYVDFIISHESGWRPGAYNAGSGAYGLCQSLPASKMASAGADYLTNPVTQLRWCSSYSSRYGGWQGAYNAWLVQKWW